MAAVFYSGEKTAAMPLLFLSFVLTLALIILLSVFSRKRKMGLKAGVPVVGGIALGITVLAVASSRLLFPPVKGGMAILAASAIMLLFGVIDDVNELSVAAKFLTQLVSAAVLIGGGVRTHIVFIGELPNIILTLLWILGMTNAFNHLDVMDGIAGICALTAAGSLAIIAFLNADSIVFIINGVLCAGLAAFLFFNLPPAKVYLGNAGSHFTGFIIAAAAMKLSYAPSKISLAIFAPVLILCFPIIDTLFLILMRIKNRMSVFNKSNDHLVLRLAQVGMSKRRIALLVFAVCCLFSALGLAAVRMPDTLLLTVMLVVFSFVALFLFKMSKIEVRS
jgi:UDP-GlcNAc:undecaprenyl-phosphate/decaprenyl-phosphate GlcNAc-1-phosphate transferase